MLAGVACVPKQGKTEEVCSNVHEHELEVTAMAAGTRDARTMAMQRNETREGDGKDRGFTVGVLLESIGVGDERKRRGKVLPVKQGRKRTTGR